METKKYESRYSGPNCSGVCICGCSWDEHHMMLVMRQEYIDETKEGYILGECEAFGFNEVSGKKYNEEEDVWELHCNSYRDSKLNDKH